MQRNQAVALVALVLAALGAATWWAFHGDEAPEAPPSKPTLKALTPFEIRADEHDQPYVDALEFDPDIRELKTPGPIMDESSEAYLAWRNNNKVEDPPLLVTVNFENATVSEVAAKLNELAKARGVRVYADETKEIAAMVADQRFTFSVEQKPFFEVIDLIRGHSGDRVRYYNTSLGIVIGGEAAIQKAQLDAAAATAKRLAERDRTDPLLDVEYRPDFTDAKIWSIRNNIRLQTKVQVIVDEATWKNGHTLTWREDPMPLRDALERICEEFGCVFRIKGNRVFLLKP